MAQEAGLFVNIPDYERVLEESKERARKGSKKHNVTAVKGELPTTDDSPKYRPESIDVKVVGWVINNEVITSGKLKAGDTAALLLDRTPFYAEQGGQIGDTGLVRSSNGAEFEVEDSQRLGESVLHFGMLIDGELSVGDGVSPNFGTVRRIDIMRNHTATHLLNLALRQILGQHVEQKGSLVDADKTRFDFSHDKPLSSDELRRIEEYVNQRINRDLIVTPITMPLNEAMKIQGVRAVFGEKYPDPVRVVMVGPETPELATHDDSIEFCGGTHMPRTGLIGYFKLVGQEGVAKGVRRLTGITGRHSLEAIQKLNATVMELSESFQCKPEEIPTRVQSLRDQVEKLQAQIKKGAAADLNAVADKLLAAAEEINGAKLIVGELPGAPVDAIRSQMDRLRTKAGSALIVLVWNDEGKVGVLVALTDDLVKKGLSASVLIGPIAEACGGKGGGKRADLAQAGGKDPSKINDAIKKATDLGRESLRK